MSLTAVITMAAVGVSLAGQFSFPTTGVSVQDHAVLLAIDDASLPLKQNLCYYLSKPTVRKEAVLSPMRDDPTAPDFAGPILYGTVLFDEGQFRMWYKGHHFGENYSDLKQGPTCYAQSDDGTHWVRPNLGQVEVKGSRDNNAIKLPDESVQMAGVLKDHQDPDPQRRYKMVYNPNNGKTWVLRTATSPDGINWTASPNYATDKFLEISSFYRHNGLFVVHGQSIESGGESGFAQGRQGYARISAGDLPCSPQRLKFPAKIIHFAKQFHPIHGYSPCLLLAG